jgi:hypothetical protein
VGASFARNAKLREAPPDRMFPALPAAEFGADAAASEAALTELAARMTAEAELPKDGPDPEESGIPAAFTYLGQFIDHDLTFDPGNSLQLQKNRAAEGESRAPRLNLDVVYGGGPDAAPYLYENGRRLLQGRLLTGAAANAKARDVPRGQFFAPSGTPAPAPRVILGDPRNDANVIVSQLHGLFLRLHNKLADAHATGADAWSFERVRQEVGFHYQWVVVNDFLPTIVADRVLKEVLLPLSPKGRVRFVLPNLRFYQPHNEAFLPLEFSAAAFRFRHSMVRHGYRLNETIRPLAMFGPNPNQSLAGSRAFPANWAIDWNLFTDLQARDPDDTTRTQLAHRIDTSLVSPLGGKPVLAAGVPSSAGRNLLRSWRMRLPSGQSVARAMGLTPLVDKEILIGKFTGDPADIITTIDQVADGAFKENCPLWTYILAETVESSMALRTTTGVKHIRTRKLGPVGGRLVAETIVGILLQDDSSYLVRDPLWTPSLAVKARFGLRELIATALS